MGFVRGNFSCIDVCGNFSCVGCMRKFQLRVCGNFADGFSDRFLEKEQEYMRIFQSNLVET